MGKYQLYDLNSSFAAISPAPTVCQPPMTMNGGFKCYPLMSMRNFTTREWTNSTTRRRRRREGRSQTCSWISMSKRLRRLGIRRWTSRSWNRGSQRSLHLLSLREPTSPSNLIVAREDSLNLSSLMKLTRKWPSSTTTRTPGLSSRLRSPSFHHSRLSARPPLLQGSKW